MDFPTNGRFNEMNRINHECIRAFAGSGKTHTLVNRYIRLLALGVEPSRINALTFTRKASGEFLQKIFLRLSAASGDMHEAVDLSKQIGMEQLNSGDFRKLLKILIKDIGKLQLGTIDSFFAKLVGAFPYELGLSRTHRIMDDFEHSVARQLSMEKMLGSGNPHRDSQILQIYKNLTWGSEEKNVYPVFQEKFRNHQSLYQEVHDNPVWGNSSLIFKDPPWWLTEEKDMEKAVIQARSVLNECDFDSRLHNALLKLLDGFESWSPGKDPGGGSLLIQFLEKHDEMEAGNVQITYYRKETHISDPFSSSLLQILRIYLSLEISRKVVLTQALGELLEEFDNHYNQTIRETGNLVFHDFPALLINGLCRDNPVFNNDDILYRLDNLADHWLLDEFQDTSRIQWKVLSVFIDEIIQDPENRRSFFYVGDIKQSIYTWRGGDPRLFDEILDHYNTNNTTIETQPLEYSWRSAPAILDCVNKLFGEGISGQLAGNEVHARWAADWLDHKASSHTEKLNGYAGWGLVEDKSSIAVGCVELIQKVDPLKRGLGCAVLVRKNKEVLEITQALREAGIPASMEGVDFITRDNVVGRWILAFLQSLIYPENRFFREYLCMPMISCDGPEYKRLAGLIRWVLTTQGYPKAIQKLVDYLGDKIEFTSFLKHRCKQFIEAATRFDSNQMDGLPKFIDYLNGYSVSESSVADQIQVMTVHKAKGLDFDMAIVAGFGGESLVGTFRDSLHVERADTGDVEWILDMPHKQVVEADHTLAQAHLSHKDTQVYESLCTLYVAMTRAKLGLYCIAEKPSRSSSASTWNDLYSTTRSDSLPARQEGLIEWQSEWGDAEWFNNSTDKETRIPDVLLLDKLETIPHQKPFRKRMSSPSVEAHSSSSEVTPLRSTAGRRFGTRMHDFLSTIKWVGDDVLRVSKQAPIDLRQRFIALLDSPIGKEVFSEPDYPYEIWREKPYVYRKQDRVAHGIIDRATVEKDAFGKPVFMTIYDFKTDQLDPDKSPDEQLMEKYHLQLERYREAAQLLTGLPAEKIRTVLVPV